MHARAYGTLKGMPSTMKQGVLTVLVLLSVFLDGCWSETGLNETGPCGPRDLTPECCLKQFPGAWEQCTGSSELGRSLSIGQKVVAAGMSVPVAVLPVIGAGENRGAELAADLLPKVEEALVRCVREADRRVNDIHFQGKSPSAEICGQIKVGERTTWAAYLGLFKHEESWPCLRAELDKLMPGRYLLHPRFKLNEQTGQWEHWNENKVKEIIASQGWTGLTGTIEPDLILMDATRLIVRIYDLKFPCPDTNWSGWRRYLDGPNEGSNQGRVYKEVLHAEAFLVSPRRKITKE